MNQEIENVEKVKKRVYYAGFGTMFHNEIDQAAAAGTPRINPSTEFAIQDASLFDPNKIQAGILKATPDITISDENKMYYNGYLAVLEREGETPIRQWFKSTDRINVDEAYRLMSDTKHPRAILKEYLGEDNRPYKAYVQLDFSQKTKNDNYFLRHYPDFDLMSKLREYDFEGMKGQYKSASRVLSSGGGIELVPVNREKYETVFIILNPTHSTLTIMDKSGDILEHDQFRTLAAREQRRVEQEQKEPRGIRQSNVRFVAQNGPSESKDAGQVQQPEIGTSPTNEVKKNSRTVKPAAEKKGRHL
ncbi:hypothetical protein [Chitinophaga defluvii]|uniref:DUF3945 domain-containing protein n=1 Tax=Chitinophaga defluvii TaxID=3163343 RepID=A0ABV2T8W8_9BACT